MIQIHGTLQAPPPPAAPPLRLTKTKLVAARQCPRRLWLMLHRPVIESLPAGRERVIAEGHRVGALARRLAEQQTGLAGELIDVQDGWEVGLARCRERLTGDGPVLLFEAPFAVDAGPDGRTGLAVIADIVHRDQQGRLHLIEVKSSTRLAGKPYAEDAAVQAWAMAATGQAPQQVVIRLIDRSFAYAGDGDYSGLLRDEDVSDTVAALQPQVAQWLADGAAIAEGGEPTIRPGAHCLRPYPCGFRGHCDAADAALHGPPPTQPVAWLTGGRNLGKLTAGERAQITEAGWTDLGQLPPDFPADGRARATLAALRSGRPWVSPGLREALRALPWPRWHLDFETIGLAIPRWAGAHPFDALPFQWSCHVEQADGSVEHHAFLDLSGDDPRPACAQALAGLLAPLAAGQAGCVLAWNADFERQQLSALAAQGQSTAAPLRAAVQRLHDLLPIVRQHWYHPAQQASYSLKAVLPAVAPELDHADLDEVQHGEAAQAAWLEAVDEATPPARREQLRQRLLAYCERDTWAMVVLSRRLAEWPTDEEVQ